MYADSDSMVSAYVLAMKEGGPCCLEARHYIRSETTPPIESRTQHYMMSLLVKKTSQYHVPDQEKTVPTYKL